MAGQHSRKGKEPEQTQTPAAGPALAAGPLASSQVIHGSRPPVTRSVMPLEDFKTFLATEKVLWEDPTARSFDEHGKPVFRPDLHHAILRQRELLWPQQQQQQQHNFGLVPQIGHFPACDTGIMHQNLLRGPQPCFPSLQMVEETAYTPQFLTYQPMIQLRQGNADPGLCGHYDAELGGQLMNGGGWMVWDGSVFDQGGYAGSFTNVDPGLLNRQGHLGWVQDADPSDQDDSSTSYLPQGGWQI
ncbi:hypothetical protein CSHISOI_02884 [Colletotrichum shisoi]|uniref:Uncharacterized protein n=1 Tax=Colletotrichum shisoi TaxID=2078593 RepID=A0A5Q4BZZ4_9PEZI|nr:hypothetical protein CSHISOI_02884 [Colletotrichum shisoi]